MCVPSAHYGFNGYGWERAIYRGSVHGERGREGEGEGEGERHFYQAIKKHAQQ